ncbi:MAG: ABC1 kinase family protein, partial [Planctomycetota bacterium]
MLRSFRTIRNIPRLKDITFILMRHGLHQVASQLGAPFRVRLRGLWPGTRRTPLSQAERLRLAFQELGPLFIKLGQLIANRPDVFPRALVAEFAKLEDRVDPLPFEELRAVLEKELGGEPSTRLESVDEEPLASASISQVHRAVTLEGERVILKIQKPGVRRIIEQDLEILAMVAEALASAEEFETLDPEALAAEVRRALERELNFDFERNALDRVRASFEGDPVMVVPRTFPELSTRRLLVMEHLEGTSLRRARLSGAEAHRAARECTRILFEMVFRDGYFHADPHASNILAMPDGRLGWVDFGSMGLFTEEMRGRLGKVLAALLERDYEALARQILRLGRPRGEIAGFDFSQDLATRLDPFFGLTLKELDVAALFGTILELARDHRITIAPGFILMTRCLVLMEGLAHHLDPDFNTSQEVEPLARRLAFERLRPDHLLESAGDHVLEMLQNIWEVPRQLAEILRRLAQGRMQVDTHLQGLRQLNRRLESSSNRIVQAMIVSSLLVSSSLVMGLDIGPMLGGVP